MSNTVSAGQQMIQEFVVVTPDTTVEAAEAELDAKNADYCVVRTSEGEPLALLTDEQLHGLTNKDKSLVDELPNLPAAVPVEREQLLSDIVRELSLILLASRQIRGLVVLHLGNVVGILSRQLVADQALTSFNLRGISGAQIEGNETDLTPTYLCPQGDYSEQVVSYDRLHPPTCPTHQILLVRKKS